MSQQNSIESLKRHLPHAFAATILIAIAPVVVVGMVPPFTSLPWFFSIAAGMALSFGASQGANLVWVKWLGTEDLVFGDLMLWGWLRRFRVERRIERVAARLTVLEQGPMSGDLSARDKTRILTDLVAALEARDPYTHGHSRRVTRHAFMIAKAMSLPKEQIERIRIAASVHDVGKLGIPLSIIRKPGKLTDDEFAQIAEHAAKGGELVEPLGDPLLSSIVRHHHERIDGSGYPDRLAGDAIPLGARIIAVADTFDAITSTRAYRKASKHSAAIQIMKKEAGRQLDADVVKAFMGYYSGRRSIEWWMIASTLPQRAWASLGGWGRSAVALPAVQGVAATGTAVLLASSLGPGWNGPVLPDEASDRAVRVVAEAHDGDTAAPAEEYGGGVGAKGRGRNGPNHRGRGHGKNGNKGGGRGRSGDHPDGKGDAPGRDNATTHPTPAAPSKPEKPEKPSKDDAAVAEVVDETTETVTAPAAPAPAAPAAPEVPSKPDKPGKPSKTVR